ncbi:MAG: D-galactarate dehydratase [Proteobacteria bacterium]|nr:D-galactarate dehydratase [Pseudomonadota bacterium]
MGSRRKPAVIIHPSDNVATALQVIPQGTCIFLKKGGKAWRIVVCEEIPMGHKFSLSRVEKGGRIIKYGETIGIATTHIDIGYHVHIHNLESRRGRGDLEE